MLLGSFLVGKSSLTFDLITNIFNLNLEIILRDHGKSMFLEQI